MKKSDNEINLLDISQTEYKSDRPSKIKTTDINILLNRARKVQEKETRTNLVFGGLIVCLIFVVGLILSF